MTDSLETQLRESFARAALDAPAGDGLVGVARERAVRHRRRVAVGAGSLAVAAMFGAGVWLARAATDRPGPNNLAASSPANLRPLTAEECPGGVSSGSPLSEAGSGQSSPEDLVRSFAAQVILPRHPTARLREGEVSPSRRTYVYQLPNGDRVAMITYEQGNQGWSMASEQFC